MSSKRKTEIKLSNRKYKLLLKKKLKLLKDLQVSRFFFVLVATTDLLIFKGQIYPV